MNERTPLCRIGTDPNGNTLWMKREDLLPFSFGGNKARIAGEYVSDLLQSGADHMVCYGNARSNLCRALTNLCASQGLPCTVICPADDDGSRVHTANEAMCRLCGADIVPCDKTNVAETVDRVLADIREKGGHPYYIYGNRLGTGKREVPVRAYVPVWEEITEQAAEKGFMPDRVALACGTGMTAAGLLCGQLLSGSEPISVHAFSVARDEQAVCAHVLDYARAFAMDTDQADDFADRAMDCFLCDDSCRGVYGSRSEETDAFIRRFYCEHGIALDPTYTGKALYALTRAVTAQDIRNEQIVFIHTGGIPLFFDFLNTSEPD